MTTATVAATTAGAAAATSASIEATGHKKTSWRAFCVNIWQLARSPAATFVATRLLAKSEGRMSVNQFRIQLRAPWAVIVGLLATSTSAHASPILSIRGEIEGLASFLGNSYNQVLAQEWTTTEKYSDVIIAVSVESLFPSFRTGTAFLTSNIGPGATTGDLIASDVFDVPLTSAYNTQVSRRDNLFWLNA